MRGKILLLSIMISVFFIPVDAADTAVLVHNTRRDIEAVKGKLKLKLVRVWGGDEEEDENKFFKTPRSIVADDKGLIYICDQYRHCIKVFKNSGEYLRTIGRRGKGPADLYNPEIMAISPNGDLVVLEHLGYRAQRFSPEGKSKKIIKLNGFSRWIGVTSKDQLVIYNQDRTFRSRILASIYDNKGKAVMDIGTFHDKHPNSRLSESLDFKIDGNDNLFVMNTVAPVIRKYSLDGKMLMAITFEPPFEIPIRICLNPRGNEIKRIEKLEDKKKEKVAGGGNRRVIQGTRRRPKVFMHIDIDSRGRIYVVTRTRLKTNKEKGAYGFIASKDHIKIVGRENALAEKIDYLSILVFAPDGKIIAESPLTTHCEDIHVKGNRIFINEGFITQRIGEYEIAFED